MAQTKVGGEQRAGHRYDAKQGTAFGHAHRFALAMDPKHGRGREERVGGDHAPHHVVSLTVNAVEGATFAVNLVPHTLDVTILRDYRPGTRVNFEIDIIARYVERMFTGSQDVPSPR